MEYLINQVIAKDLIIASPLKNEALRIKEGQTFSGRIISVSEQGIVLNLAGLKILAKTNLPLFEGSEVNVRVENITDDQIVLKLLDQNTGLRSTLQPLTDSDIQEVLLSLNVKQSPENAQIVKTLTEAGLPVSKELITNVSDLLKSLNLTGDNNIKTVIALIAKGVPVTQSSVDAFNSLTNGHLLGDELLSVLRQISTQSNLPGSNANDLVQIIRNLLPVELSDSKEVVTLINRFAEQLSFEGKLLNTLSSEVSRVDLAALLKESISNILNEAVSKINSVPFSSFKETGIPVNIANVIAGIMDELGGATTLTQLQNLGVKALSASTMVFTKLEAIPLGQSSNMAINNLDFFLKLSGAILEDKAVNIKEIAETNLKSNVLKLVEVLEQSAKGSADVKQLAHTLSNIANNISGQQISGHSQSGFNQLPEYAYLQIPFVVDDRFQTVELIINSNKGKSGKADPDNTSIAIFLDMPSLGMVGTNLQFVEGKGTCHFYVEEEKVKSYFDANISELSDIFANALNKQVEIDCTVTKKEKIKPDFKEKIFGFFPQKIDIVA